MSYHIRIALPAKKFLAIIIIAVIACIGVYLALGTRAAVPSLIGEPENGTFTAPATKITDSTASLGSAIKFAAGAVTDNEFSFVAIPDTQQEVIYPTNRPEFLVPGTSIYMNQYFNQRMKWIADNKANYNIKYVWQVGDLQNWDTDNHDQYVMASNGLKILEQANIPFSLANGNHDNMATGQGGGARDGTKTKVYFRTVDTWNSFYPTSRFPGMKTLCSEFAQFNSRLMAADPTAAGTNPIDRPQYVKDECARSDSTVNAYRTFTAGGLKWVIINYEMWPRQVVQEWMKTVLERYPDHNAILINHYHIEYGGGLSTSGGYGAPQGSPRTVFDNVVKQYPNVKFVSSGHVSQNADCAIATGVNGNVIHHYLNDRLSGQDTPNYVRLIKFNVSAKTITSQHFMPNPAEAARVPGNPAQCNETNVNWIR